MKKIILIIVLSFMVGVTLYSQDSHSVAQSNSEVVRIAYINRDSILVAIPQVEAIEKEYRWRTAGYGVTDEKTRRHLWSDQFNNPEDIAIVKLEKEEK